jgi:tRNA threonylcarbamoyladenosine biosynthesis protein TsaE
MKKQSETITYSCDEIDVVAQRIIQLFSQCHIITLAGPLGAGKTSLVQAVLRKCGVTQPVVSPTFTYVQTYQSGDMRYHHFDLYRVTSVKDFVLLGFEEYLNNMNDRVFIEWPEVIKELLDKRVCVITMDYQGPDARRATIE